MCVGCRRRAGVGLFAALAFWAAPGLRVRLFDEKIRRRRKIRAPRRRIRQRSGVQAAGLADDMARVGLVCPIFQFWDRPLKSASRRSLDHALPRQGHRLPDRHSMRAVQDRAVDIGALARPAECRGASGVIASPMLGRRTIAVTVTVAGRRRRKVATAALYLVGADGGRSVGAQGLRYRFRRLFHLARAVHRADDAVRFRGK